MRAIIRSEVMPHNNQSDDIEVDAEGCGDGRDDAQRAMNLVFRCLAGHGNCENWTKFFLAVIRFSGSLFCEKNEERRWLLQQYGTAGKRNCDGSDDE